MKTRNIFAELTEGFDALQAQRQSKIALRTTKVTRKIALAISGRDVAAVRE